MNNKLQMDIENIIRIIREAGYNPYEQLYAYLNTGNDSYITRKGNARVLVAELNREELWAYIEPHIKQKGR